MDTMTTYEAERLRDAVARYLEGQAEWRAHIAKRFPDAENGYAEAALRAAASEVRAMPLDDPLFADPCVLATLDDSHVLAPANVDALVMWSPFGEEASATARRFGYRVVMPVRELVTTLAAQSAAALAENFGYGDDDEVA